MSDGTYSGSYGDAITLTVSPAIIMSGATVDSAGAYAVYAGIDATLENDGIVLATGSAGIAIDLTLGGYIENSASGTIEATGYGSTAIGMGATGTVVNAGLIEVLFSSTDSNSTGIGIDMADGGSIDNIGTIDLVHGAKAYSGLIGVELGNGGTITNTGEIDAGKYSATANADARSAAGHHQPIPLGLRVVPDQYTGLGVGLNNATLYNSGHIYGRNVGAKISSGGYIDNLGAIDGHQVGVQMDSGLLYNTGTVQSSGSYAAGVYLSGGTVINDGIIQGGADYKDYGIYVLATDIQITNQAGGLIEGATGIYFKGAGADTLYNAGTVKGDTYSVSFYNGQSGTIFAEAGAVFIGTIAGHGGVIDLYLESGTSQGTIDGLTGVSSVTFAGGASWAFQGDNTILNGLDVYGGTVTVDGTIDGSNGPALEMTSSSDLLVLDPGATFNGTIYGGGTLELAGGTGGIEGLGGTAAFTGGDYGTFVAFGAYVIDQGGTWTLYGDNTINVGDTLAVDGTVTVYGAASLENDGVITVYGGALGISGGYSGSGAIEIGGAGGVAFVAPVTDATIDFTGTGAVALAQGGAYGGISVDNIGVGDSIDLSSVGYQSGDTVTYTNYHLYVYSDANVLLADIQASEGPGIEGFVTVFDGSSGTLIETVICFMPGTRIATPVGEVAVEHLAVGDLVNTLGGDPAPIRWIGRQTVSTKFGDLLRILPIRIEAGALGQNLPVRDLLCSPDHAILIDDVLVQAGALVNGTTITRETDVPEVFTYYHIECDGHELILAEGVPAETFVDNIDRLAFDNWEEHLALYPNGKPVAELPYPRAKSMRQVPVAVRERLCGRYRAA